MSSVWVLSIVLQWAVIVVLCVLVLSVLRQLGIVTLRLERAEGGAAAAGPAVGARPPAYEVSLAQGDGPFALGGDRRRAQLLVFLSPDCGPCAAVPGALRELDRSDVDVLVALDLARDRAPAYLAGGDLAGLDVALLEDIPGPYYVSFSPLAIALRADGSVAARGHAGTRADLERMLGHARRDDATDPRPLLEVASR